MCDHVYTYQSATSSQSFARVLTDSVNTRLSLWRFSVI